MISCYSNGQASIGNLSTKFYEIRNCTKIDPSKNKDLNNLIEDLKKNKIMFH